MIGKRTAALSTVPTFAFLIKPFNYVKAAIYFRNIGELNFEELISEELISKS